MRSPVVPPQHLRVRRRDCDGKFGGNGTLLSNWRRNVHKKVPESRSQAKFKGFNVALVPGALVLKVAWLRRFALFMQSPFGLALNRPEKMKIRERKAFALWSLSVFESTHEFSLHPQ